MATTDVITEQSTAENGAEAEAAFGSYTSVLDTARSLPEELRFKLIHALLDTLAPQSVEAAKRREAADKLVGFLAVEGKEQPTDEEVEQWLEERRANYDQAWGILRTDRQPPNDEEVERILEEARMEKYG